MPKVAILVSDVSGNAAVNTKNALQNQGHTTDVVDITTATVASLSGYDCIVCPRFTISHLDLAANLLQQLISQGKPVVLFPGAGGSDGTPQILMSSKLNLTGKTVVLPPSELTPSNQGFDSIKIENVVHPITRNYSIGNLIVYNYNSNDRWYTFQGCIAAGEPYVGILLATGDPDDSRTRDLPCVIAIEKGTLDLQGNPIGSRIVVSGVCYGNNTKYSTNGEQLLNRCVQWAIGYNIIPQIASISTSISTLAPRISIGQRISTLPTPLRLTLQQPNVVPGARVVQPPALLLSANLLATVVPFPIIVQPPAVAAFTYLQVQAPYVRNVLTVSVSPVSLSIDATQITVQQVSYLRPPVSSLNFLLNAAIVPLTPPVILLKTGVNTGFRVVSLKEPKAKDAVLFVETLDGQILHDEHEYKITGNILGLQKNVPVSVKYRINDGVEQLIVSTLADNEIPVYFSKSLLYDNKRLWDGSNDVTGADLEENVSHVLKVWLENDQGALIDEIIRTFRVVWSKQFEYKISGKVTGFRSGAIVTIKFKVNNSSEKILSTGIVDEDGSFSFSKYLLYENKRLWDDNVDVAGHDLEAGVNHTITIWAEDDQGNKSKEIVRVFRINPAVTAQLPPDISVDTPDYWTIG